LNAVKPHPSEPLRLSVDPEVQPHRATRRELTPQLALRIADRLTSPVGSTFGSRRRGAVRTPSLSGACSVRRSRPPGLRSGPRR
jgi:hypothetical protein